MRNLQCYNFAKLLHFGSQDSSVGIATRYGLDGPGIESRLVGRYFPHPSRPAPGAHPASYTEGIGSLPGQSGRGVAFTTHPYLKPSLKKSRAKPLLPPKAFVACSRVPFTFTFYSYTSTPSICLRGVDANNFTVPVCLEALRSDIKSRRQDVYVRHRQ
jgi:hypothetical protein